MHQICWSAGASAFALSISAASSRLSTTAATAPESAAIHAACPADEVSYTGTETAPANQSAKSVSVHS